MWKSFTTGAALIVAAFSFGCGSGASTTTPSSNTAANIAAPSNSANRIDTSNMPEGLNPNPIQPGGTPTPGIPANLGPLPKGATPTPGIPDPATLKKPMKPGLTPTPGIPSPEELRRQMNRKIDVNSPVSDQPMMKKDANKLPKKPN